MVQWGAIGVLYASASVAIFFTWLMPPVWPQSGWRMSMHRSCRYGIIPQIVRSRSPVASGIWIACLSRLKTSMLPGTAGSSMNSTSYALIAWANWISIGGGTAQWASNMTAPSGPTFLRELSTILTRFSMSFGLPDHGWGPPVPALRAFSEG